MPDTRIWAAVVPPMPDDVHAVWDKYGQPWYRTTEGSWVSPKQPSYTEWAYLVMLLGPIRDRRET